MDMTSRTRRAMAALSASILTFGAGAALASEEPSTTASPTVTINVVEDLDPRSVTVAGDVTFEFEVGDVDLVSPVEQLTSSTVSFTNPAGQPLARIEVSRSQTDLRGLSLDLRVGGPPPGVVDPDAFLSESNPRLWVRPSSDADGGGFIRRLQWSATSPSPLYPEGALFDVDAARSSVVYAIQPGVTETELPLEWRVAWPDAFPLTEATSIASVFTFTIEDN
jgi:hypothetical protein